MRSKSQQFVLHTPNLTSTTDANKVRFISNSNCLPDSWSYAGVGVKQSGNRLFQLNNLQREIVDELYRFLVLSHSLSFSRSF
ncbi:hypothetical protein FAJ35_00755 [Streptococcus suis]|uniref:Uncharacterized protein n=1 Tax=Streptococcus suis TaxID=1307 RepID=A0A426GB07_STRSU|nr:hypothetical protein D2E16_08620 [Streptococcus suis]RRN52365.1 hypothetical protein EI220_01775 [Streptococcus suis]TII03988.1 hypothetical protein FAJ35_00755 [Streptococcus suis]